jgi:hypothetical protein
MVKLLSIRFWQLPNSVHYAFYTEHFLPLLMAAGDPVLMVLAQLLQLLNAVLAKETALMEWQRASEFTQQMADADHQVDHSLSGIKAQVKAKLYSTDAIMVAAAHRINMMLKRYGRVASKSYEAEVGDVKAILGRLQGDLAADVAAVGLTEQVSELQACFEAFNALFHTRSQQQMLKPDESFHDVRQNADGISHQIAAVIDANALINTAPEFAALIAKLNPEIEYFNTHYRKSKHNLAAAKPDAITPQPYTGSAITPTPRVFLSTAAGAAELAAGKDFTYSYKNNVERGSTAQCIVHGKGGYSGSVAVTFAIV